MYNVQRQKRVWRKQTSCTLCCPGVRGRADDTDRGRKSVHVGGGGGQVMTGIKAQEDEIWFLLSPQNI